MLMNMSILSTDEYVHSGTSYTRCYQFEGCEMPSILGSDCINPSGDVVVNIPLSMVYGVLLLNEKKIRIYLICSNRLYILSLNDSCLGRL
jgi:hypothetical protein